jgi:hypothetical protein
MKDGKSIKKQGLKAEMAGSAAQIGSLPHCHAASLAVPAWQRVAEG